MNIPDSDLSRLTRLLNEMCECWGITPDKLKAESRETSISAMRMLYWLAAYQKYPEIPYHSLAQMVRRSSHAGVIRGIKRVMGLLYVEDATVMTAYYKVKKYISL